MVRSGALKDHARYGVGRDDVAFGLIGDAVPVGSNHVVLGTLDDSDSRSPLDTKTVAQAYRAGNVRADVVSCDDVIVRSFSPDPHAFVGIGGNDVPFNIVSHSISVCPDAVGSCPPIDDHTSSPFNCESIPEGDCARNVSSYQIARHHVFGRIPH